LWRAITSEREKLLAGYAMAGTALIFALRGRTACADEARFGIGLRSARATGSHEIPSHSSEYLGIGRSA
jgi:hypothetical protein